MDEITVAVTRRIISAVRLALALYVAGLLFGNSILYGFMHTPLVIAAEQPDIEQNYVPIIICTANGIKTVSVPSDMAQNGRLSPESSKGYDGFQCAICGLGNHAVGMPVEPEMPQILRIELSNAVTALHITARLHDFCPIAAPPRAPPVSI